MTDRVAELQEQLSAAGREAEEIRNAKAKDASDLLANAKERLEILHTEVRISSNHRFSAC